MLSSPPGGVPDSVSAEVNNGKFHNCNQTWWSLRVTYGLLAFLAGLDKFFNVLTNWEHYLSPDGGIDRAVQCFNTHAHGRRSRNDRGNSHSYEVDPDRRLHRIGLAALHRLESVADRILL